MMHTTFTTPNTSLPLELVELVLSYLPPRHLIHSALVCHSWALLARRQLNQDVYIHSNRQYTRWLETLETACIQYRRIVRKVVVHPQVHLDLSDLQLLRLCPWIESFDISTKSPKDRYNSPQKLDINDIIGRRNRYPQLLYNWRYLKRLHGYHSDPSTVWAPLLHSQLTSLVCSYDDICMLSTTSEKSVLPYLSFSAVLSQPSCVFSGLLELDMTFGFMDVPVTTLEMIHTICPVLETLKLHVQSMHGTTNSSQLTAIHADDCLLAASPVNNLKSLKLYDMVHFDPGCYSYLLHKYPLLNTLHLGFAFDEFYTSELVRPTADDEYDDSDLCAYLQKSRSDLFELISGYGCLTRLEIHLQGANEYVSSLWPSEKMKEWMQGNNKRNDSGNGDLMETAKRTCRLQHLEMTYQRQSAEHSTDILGLDGIINSWVGQHQLHTLLLDVYNNSVADALGQTQQQHNSQHSLQSTLNQFLYSDGLNVCSRAALSRNLATICIKCFPGFDVSLTCLLDDLPGLKTLDLTFANLINRKRDRSQLSCSSYGLQQLVLESTNVKDTDNLMDIIQNRCQQLTTLCFENVMLDDNNGDCAGNTTMTLEESKMRVWDLSDRGLKHVWFKYLSFGLQGLNKENNVMVNRLKVHETTANRFTWYNTSMSQGTHGSSKPFCLSDHDPSYPEDQFCFGNTGASLELKCYFVEDLLFC
ncbi:hypothetical protein BCR42DRAFT_401028 [Absidia repens]|uniref:F-box domain-containing protein n=1 Tax=Absidia repens TaxID=90262 RepID=A0A1X2J1Z1_9FUNG|nr:hypothetical protein BCR42DRAFT_401028 [Absidia repens]